MSSQSPFSSSASPSNNMESNPVAEGDGIDIQYYVRLLFLNKWKIIFFVGIVTALTVAYVKPMPAIYYTEATMLIETDKANVVGLQDIYSSNTRHRTFLATQYEIIRSRALAEKVVDRLNLVRHREYDGRQKEPKKSLLAQLGLASDDKKEDEGPQMSDEEMDAFLRPIITRIVSRSLAVNPVRRTQLVKIGYTSGDPKLAADIANAMADVYIESYLEARLDVTKKAASWLSGRLDELRDNLQSSEERLQAYKERERLVDVEGVRTLDAAELTQLRNNLVVARQARADAQTLYQQAQTLPVDQLMGIPALLNNPIIQGAVQAKADADRNVADLSKRYGPRHPLMLSALTTQEQLGKELSQRVKSAAGGLRAGYQSALKTEQELERQISNARFRLQNVGRKEVKLRELERDVETNRQLYDLFLSRGKETDETSRLQEPPARVVDSAVAPAYPIGPNKKKFVMAALVFSSGLIVGLIILLDFLKSTVRTSDDVENRLRIPMLGFVPYIKSNKSKYAFRAFGDDSNDMGFAESIRTIRTSLVLASLESPFKVIVVTSSVPGEGKSTLALNMAEAMGQMEKVLLIDGDMRKPTVGKALGLPSSTVGLSNAIMGKAKLDSCTQRVPGMQIDIMSSGMIPNNPLELLGSSRFKRMLEDLKGKYDRIIIDSAPVHIVSDAKILSSYADSLIYVVKSDSTPLNIVSKGVKSLRSVNAPITGAVLNQVDLKKASQYDTYYGVYEQGYDYITDGKSAS
ncbi:MAG: GumC family protein [Cellvibrionaceae bacterium]